MLMLQFRSTYAHAQFSLCNLTEFNSLSTFYFAKNTLWDFSKKGEKSQNISLYHGFIIK